MLISIWWVVAALIVGGTGGALGVAICAAKPEGEVRDTTNFDGMKHTH